MILNQAFQKGRSLVNDRLVVARLRAMQSGFERAGVAHAGRSAVTLDQEFVEEQGVRRGDVLGHSASDRYSSSRSRRLSWKASSTFRRAAC